MTFIDLDSWERPRVVRVRPRLYALVFNQIKVIAARHILRTGLRDISTRPSLRVFESSSGSMALALALACRELNVPLTIVTDAGMEAQVRENLRAGGVDVQIVESPSTRSGPQQARLALLHRLMAGAADPFWCRQYDNPAARAAYAPVVDRLLMEVGAIDELVATVGTGASACGMVERLRVLDHDTQLIAVDTHGSVLFGHEDRARVLRGLGNSIQPKNLRHELVDECHWVTAADALHGAARLLAECGVDGGPTSGAAFLVASWVWSTRAGTIAFVCADGGDRYRRTGLSADWLARCGAWTVGLPTAPVTVNHPRACPQDWSRFAWGRRQLVDVMKTTP